MKKGKRKGKKELNRQTSFLLLLPPMTSFQLSSDEVDLTVASGSESPGQVRVRELSSILSASNFKWRKLSKIGQGSYGTVYLGVIEGKVCAQ